MRRMDRYKEDSQRVNRMEKNRDLYQELINNTKYTNITDVANANAFELGGKEDDTSREHYQQLKKYNGVEDVPKVKKELDDFNYLYPKKEKRIYDINSVLEEARKNRDEKDDLEEKRKLKYTSYNILAGVNLEELAKYREEKKNRKKTPQEEEIHDLMDTIASKTLAGELSKEETVDLLSDLMATNMMDKVDPADEIGDQEEQAKEESKEPEIIETQTIIEDTAQLEVPEEEEEVEEGNTQLQEEINLDEVEDEPTEEKTLDKDFYTKSMDLSTKDLDLADDFKEAGLPVAVKLLITFLILTIIAIAVYFIYLKIK
ncbi:MAG: hypothetical protein J6X28_06205 [Bacilli bacterium]|nr:hypothetical protein [Bacilli bacterium]